MTTKRTARGRMIDIGAMVKKNAHKRGVGNRRVNARGDRLDDKGKVMMSVEQLNDIQEQVETKDDYDGEALKKVSDETVENDIAQVQKAAKNIMKPRPKATRKKKPTEVSRTEKTREDGTAYTEIEYNDGSISVEEETK